MNRFRIDFIQRDPRSDPEIENLLNGPAGAPLLHNAVLKGEVIGRQVLVPFDLKTNDGYLKVALSSASEVDEKYRGLGVFPVLFNEAVQAAQKSGIEFIYGFPNEQSYKNFTEHLNFRSIGIVPLLVKPVNPYEALSRFLPNRWSAYLLSLLFVSVMKGYAYVKKARPVEKINIFAFNDPSPRVDVLWDHAKNERNFMVVKNSTFFKWRYMKGDYIKLAGVDNKTGKCSVMTGCVLNKFGYRIGFIIDLLSDDKDSFNLGRQLLEKMEEMLKAHNIDFLCAAALPKTFLFRLLRKVGFFTLPQRVFKRNFWVVGRPLTEKASVLSNIDDWVFTFSDFDNV